MKCRIIRIEDGSRIDKRVPPPFRQQVQPRKWEVRPVTLLLFPHDRRDVVHSRHVANALARIEGESGRVVALAGSFTSESQRMLAKVGADMFTLSEFVWTDDSHERIKVPFHKRTDR